MCFRTAGGDETGVTAVNIAAKSPKVQPLKIWHERFCHQNLKQTRSVLKRENIEFIDNEFFCEDCAAGKQHGLPFGASERRATSPGQLVHVDVCGPMQKDSIGGSRYFLLFKDDYSHFRTVYFLKNKSEVSHYLEQYLSRVKADTGYQPRVLRSDNGLEFMNKEVQQLLLRFCVNHHTTVPYTPQQNGRAERENRTIVEAARTIIHAKGLEISFWAEAVNCTVFVLNRTGPSGVNDRSPYELWYGIKPKIDFLRVFGTECFVLIPKEKRQKWDKKSVKAIFMGYEENTKGYRVWIPSSGKIQTSRDVIFNELNEDREVVVRVSMDSGRFSPKECDDLDKTRKTEAESDDNYESTEQSTPIKQRLRNAKMTCNIADLIECYALCAEQEPRRYQEAVTCRDSLKWKQAMNEEMESLVKNHTWDLVKIPSDHKIIDNKWVYKVKHANANEGERYKARLVVRGFSQEYGVDYEDTFSPVIRFTSLRTILAVAAAENLKVKQFDIRTAFLNGDLNEDIFMKQPEGYDDKSGRVCKLKKSLYGLKQAPRCWNEKFCKVLKEFNLRPSQVDPCVFTKNTESKLILAIYVDDGLVTGNDQTDIESLLTYLHKNFEVKVFEPKCFLGLELEWLKDGSILVHQTSYARKVLQRFRMSDSKPVSTPAEKSSESSDDSTKIKFPFREAVGSLMYLAVGTRPDIAFAVGVVCRHLDNPSKQNVNSVKRILKYIVGTENYGILFKNNAFTSISIFSDADFGGDIHTRRSTTGYIFVTNQGPLSWSSQLQKCVALSTTEAEYIAASEAIRELGWLKVLIAEILSGSQVIPTLFVDNQSAVKLVKNHQFQKRTKHIEIRYHFVREKFKEGRFHLQYIASEEQLADIFTKPLLKSKFIAFRQAMGVVPLP